MLQWTNRLKNPLRHYTLCMCKHLSGSYAFKYVGPLSIPGVVSVRKSFKMENKLSEFKRTTNNIPWDGRAYYSRTANLPSVPLRQLQQKFFYVNLMLHRLYNVIPKLNQRNMTLKILSTTTSYDYCAILLLPFNNKITSK